MKQRMVVGDKEEVEEGEEVVEEQGRKVEEERDIFSYNDEGKVEVGEGLEEQGHQVVLLVLEARAYLVLRGYLVVLADLLDLALLDYQEDPCILGYLEDRVLVEVEVEVGVEVEEVALVVVHMVHQVALMEL